MPVSLIISNSNIRLVSTRKGNPDLWESVSIPEGLVKDGYIQETRALALVIDKFFTSRQIPRSEVRVSLTGLSFTYRILTLPRLKKGLQREAIERATQKELKVPLEELYIDWQVFANRGNEVEVFVAGIPRPPIDILVKTMELARVKLTQVDIKALAVARTVDQGEALIVDFEPDWFDVAIISRGIPVTLHSVAPKSRAASLEDNIPQLQDEINRTIDFFNLTHPDSPVTADTPIIFSGSLADDPATVDSVLDNLGRPQQKMAPPLRLPGDFPLPLFAGNIGLNLKNIDSTKSSKQSRDGYLDINIDPLKGRKREMAHPVSWRKIAAYGAITAAILLILGGSWLRNQALAETGRLQNESDRLNRILKEDRLALDQTSATAARISQLNTETSNMQKESELIAGRGRLSVILEVISRYLPPESGYIAITSTIAEVTINGRASQRSDILDYASILAQAGNFNSVRIALIEREPGNQSDNSSPGYIFKIVIRR